MKWIWVFGVFVASPLASGKETVVRSSDYSVADKLRDQLVWKMDGGTLEFVQVGGKCELRNEAGEMLHAWEAPAEVSGAVASEKGTALLVRVMKPKGRYHGIARFVREHGTWKIDEVMLGEHPGMAIRDRWVEELGAVSDDGATAILHVGEADADRGPERKGFRMFYRWETWDLSETKKLGTGLKMCNAKSE